MNSSRTYNQIYTKVNNSQGSEKILLGYKHDARDFILPKDKTTFFHIPYFTSPIYLQESTLIADGAVAGPFPAASDRIFQSRKNFGNTTPHGSPTDIANGTWFCSWLRRDRSGSVQWVDRYYNPGQLVYETALNQLNQSSSYQENNPIFRDVPSTHKLEPGVLYQYFHMGEKEFQILLATLGGVTGERLIGQYTDWEDAIQNKDVKVHGNQSNIVTIHTDLNFVDISSIDYTSSEEILITIDNPKLYTLQNEFTISVDAWNKNWQNTPSSQLFGNYTTRGGYGVFVQNLSSYSYFVIPETRYGHLLYLNQDFNGFLDKTTLQELSSTPNHIALNLDEEVCVAFNQGATTRIIKYDNIGTVLNSVDLELRMHSQGESPIQLICGKNNELNLITTHNVYLLDSSLSLTTFYPKTSSVNTVATYLYDISNDSYELLLAEDAIDVKFIENQKWHIARTNGNLYKTNPNESSVLHQTLSGASSLAVDPYNNIWIATQSKIVVYSSSGQPFDLPLATIELENISVTGKQHIGFICAKNQTWHAVIHVEGSTNLIICDLNGKVEKIISKSTLYNSEVLRTLNQSYENLEYSWKGDFTGYEQRRIFGKLSPYKGNTQLVLKTALTTANGSFAYNKKQISIANWKNETWQNIVLTLKQKQFFVYVNQQPVIRISYDGSQSLSYRESPPFALGSTNGSVTFLSQEINHPSGIFNGKIGNVYIYDYAIDQQNLAFFKNSILRGQDLIWSYPIPATQYIETIERVFKNRLPGFTTAFFNLNIAGTGIKDYQTKQVIEDQIRERIREMQPAYTDLVKINWVD